ncbi:putative hydrolase [Kluyvera cryocrescens]|uniref:Putative hydrolase n=1 Tax=Kluyvera cryocrescens TaxID=580 RepID=A0A485ARS3_KLUCR|nr:putative hydrolase [Kluyvera cryocrescens]
MVIILVRRKLTDKTKETAMTHDHFVVQSPAKPAQQLLLLFHGVGDNPVAMGQIGSWFAPLFPDALIVSVGGVEPCGPAPGPPVVSPYRA